MYKVGEETVRDAPCGLHERQPHQLPELRWSLRHQDIGRLVQTRDPEQSILQVLFLEADPRATQHQLLDRSRELRRHLIPNNPSVADPHEPHPNDPEALHHPFQALGLEGHGPLGTRRVRPAEEHEVGHVHVEPCSKVPEDVAVLPHGIGAKPMHEDERGPRRSRVLPLARDPTVHQGAVAEVGGDRAES